MRAFLTPRWLKNGTASLLLASVAAWPRQSLAGLSLLAVEHRLSPDTLHAVAVSTSYAAYFSGVDADALAGAVAGAALVFASSKEVSRFTRITYMVISVIAGYQGAPEVIRLTSIRSTGLAAFLAAALAIAVTLQLIERVKTFDIKALFGRD